MPPALTKFDASCEVILEGSAGGESGHKTLLAFRASNRRGLDDGAALVVTFSKLQVLNLACSEELVDTFACDALLSLPHLREL